MTQRTDGTTRNITDAEFERRLEELLRAEDDNPTAYWFLSYVSPIGWRGLILAAPGFTHAAVFARTIGLSPGGEVMGVEIPEDQIPPREYHNRLLTKEECEEFWGTMKTVAQYDEEQKKLRLAGRAPDFDEPKDGNIRWKNNDRKKQ